MTWSGQRCSHSGCNPPNLGFRLNLATTQAERGDRSAAEVHYHAASQLDANWVKSLTRRSWSLSSSPREADRDGSTAIRLAKHACHATNHQEPECLEALAAAYAEKGDFENAIQIEQRALSLLRTDSTALTLAKTRLEGYQARQPHRQKESSATVPP